MPQKFNDARRHQPQAQRKSNVQSDRMGNNSRRKTMTLVAESGLSHDRPVSASSFSDVNLTLPSAVIDFEIDGDLHDGCAAPRPACYAANGSEPRICLTR